MQAVNLQVDERPLATIIMVTYNQERYVAYSLRGLFWQTYSPLEIVISDDCSTDKTYQIICEEIASYRARGGVHQIVVNRNGKNLGISGNCSKAYAMAHGEVVVSSAGDDISLPTRVEKVMTAWRATGGRVLAIYSNAWEMDIDGRFVGRMKMRGDGTRGAVAAYAQRLFSEFGMIDERGAAEDEIYANRALMIGKRVNLPEELVCYRVDSGVSSGTREYRARRVKIIRSYDLGACAQLLKDVEFKRKTMGEEKYVAFRKKVEGRRDLDLALLKLWDGKTFCERWVGFRDSHPPIWHPRIVLFLILLLPRKLGDMLLTLVCSILQMTRPLIFKLRRFRTPDLKELGL